MLGLKVQDQDKTAMCQILQDKKASTSVATRANNDEAIMKFVKTGIM